MNQKNPNEQNLRPPKNPTQANTKVSQESLDLQAELSENWVITVITMPVFVADDSSVTLRTLISRSCRGQHLLRGPIKGGKHTNVYFSSSLDATYLLYV